MCNCYSLSSIFLLCVKHYILHHLSTSISRCWLLGILLKVCTRDLREHEKKWDVWTVETAHLGETAATITSPTIIPLPLQWHNECCPFWSFTFSGSSLCFPRCFFQGPSCGGEEVRVSGCCFWKARGAAAPLSPYLWLLLLLLLLHHHSLILQYQKP